MFPLLILLHAVTFVALYFIYVKIEALQEVEKPSNLNPPYSSEEIIEPIQPESLYKKTGYLL